MFVSRGAPPSFRGCEKNAQTRHNLRNLFSILTRSILLIGTVLLLVKNINRPVSAFFLSEHKATPFRYYDSTFTPLLTSSLESGNVNEVDDTRRVRLLAKYNHHDGVDLINKTLNNLCYCSYGTPACDYGEICVKHEMAACFHAIRQVYATDFGHSGDYRNSEYGDDNDNSDSETELGDENALKAKTVNGFMQTQHFYGCAPLERGTNASHLTCNSWRSIQSTPSSIACCYEGHFCNANITPVTRNFENRTALLEGNGAIGVVDSKLFAALASIGVGCMAGGMIILLVIFILLPLFFRRHEKYAKEKLPRWLWGWLEAFNRSGKSSLVGTPPTCGELLLHGDNVDGKCRPIGADEFLEFDSTGSGSGSGGVTLNQRTIALDLTMLETVARGRYGEVRKAIYRGSVVAVKTFYPTEEESWKNERDIYQTHMLNHENILQYVAADISSNVESLTQMMLITDYHDYGSLYDYLRERRGCSTCCQATANSDPTSLQTKHADQAANSSISSSACDFGHQLIRREDSVLAGSDCNCYRLTLSESLQIASSIISGIEHLHNAVRGTGSRRKPEIAHRDIKSKNVIVKRPGVCCVADFGLAVRYENNAILPERINIQVGTKRYMAPEVLAHTLNTENFDEFKAADIYSFALVLWEVLQMVQLDKTATASTHLVNSADSATQHPRRIISRSSSSGIATGASDRSTSYFLPTSHHQQYRKGLLQNQPQVITDQSTAREMFELPYTIIQAQAKLQRKYNNSDSISKSEESRTSRSTISGNPSDCQRNNDESMSQHYNPCAKVDSSVCSIPRNNTLNGSTQLNTNNFFTIRRHPSAPNADATTTTMAEKNMALKVEKDSTVMGSRSTEAMLNLSCSSRQTEQQKLNSFDEHDTIVVHRLPYQDLIESDPSFEEMRRIVCETNLRPTLANETRDPIMRRLCELMRECWSENAKSRHTSLKIKKEISLLNVVVVV